MKTYTKKGVLASFRKDVVSAFVNLIESNVGV